MQAMHLPAVVLLTAAAAATPPDGAAVEALMLTWRDDPTTTMTVQWLADAEAPGGQLQFGPIAEEAWRAADASHRPFPHSALLLYTVELTGLLPGRDYRIRVAGTEAVHRFRTAPADAGAPLTFIVGGDVYREPLDERLYREAAGLEPAFVVLGGDLAYGNGRRSAVKRWVRLLQHWQETMVTPAGRLVPLVPAIGNHDVAGAFGRTPTAAPFFHSLFVGQGEPSYRVLDFGSALSVILLDSGHTHGVDEQVAWLESTLSVRRDVPHLVAAYHVPAYPSVRSYKGLVSVKIRLAWVPIFERYGLDLAFEHHDHAYKRTPPIKAGRIDPDGVVYLGDGAWGVPPRRVHRPEKTWYLDRAESVNHFIAVTIHEDRRTVRAIDLHGRQIDSLEEGTEAQRD